VGEVNFVDDYDADENVFETTMTASRNGVEEEEDSRSAQAMILPTSGLDSASQGRLLQRQQEDQQSSVSNPAVVDLGDIVNQLHDLSSFFVDDDLNPVSQGNYSNLIMTHQSSSNQEQIARILSRSAMSTFGHDSDAGSI
jgi:hypothetical protein